MSQSRRLLEPIVAAAVATVALTSFVTVILVRDELRTGSELFGFIWPIMLSSAVAAVLVMSLLYKELRKLVAELERREAAAHHQALHDQLTGLANRALLHDRMESALGRLRRDDEKFALLMLDLDHFKQVNDTLGHEAGDRVVQEVSERLTALLRETDTVARIGGDEFAILMADSRGKAAVERLCQRIILALSTPYRIGGREAHVGSSIGAVLVTDAAASTAELLRKADITLYRAKSSGRGCSKIFSEEMDAAVQRRDRLETRLRQALGERNGPEVHFQPQLSSDGRVTGFECLLRWKDRVLGDVSPAEIIPVAEESGLIHALGEHVFRRACSVARDWPGMSFAVNLSPIQFRAPDLPLRLRRLAAEENVQCRQIELEITESLLLGHGDGCASLIQELRRYGFRVALDDFGTGYSSLSYLRRFPVDKIKLDRSFIESAGTSKSVAIIRAAVHLGHAMNLEVVAEGISQKRQEAIAIEAGCTGLQGYLYSPALPARQLQSFMARRGAAQAA